MPEDEPMEEAEAAPAVVREKPRTKTQVLNLRESLRDESHRAALQALAVLVSYLEFTAMSILEGFLRRCAVATPEVLDAQFATPTSRKAQKLVCQSNAVRALACAKAGGWPTARSAKWPSLLKEAVEAHFLSAAAQAAHAAKPPDSYLFDYLVQSAVAVRLETTYLVYYKTQTGAGVKKALRLLHSLTGPDAKALSQLLGTSVADRAEQVASIAARSARHRAYKARENAQKCKRVVEQLSAQQPPPSPAALKKAKAALVEAEKAAVQLERAIEKTVKSAKNNIGAEIRRCEDAFTKPARRKKTKPASEEEADSDAEEEAPAVETVGQIARREALDLPATQSQVHQLRYRLRLLRRLEAAGHPNVFKLCPQCSFSRHHVPLNVATLAALLKGSALTGEERNAKREGEFTFGGQMRRLLTDKAVKRALHGNGGDWRLGSSATCDGHALHLVIVNSAAAEVAGRRARGAQAGKAKGRAARADGEDYINKPKHATSTNAPKKRDVSVKLKPLKPLDSEPQAAAALPLPKPGFVAVDLGNRNLLGVAYCAPGEDAASTQLATFTVSTLAYRDRTGEAPRAREAVRRVKARRLKDPAFVLAEAALEAYPPSVAGLGAACRAQQERHSVWGTLFSQYGTQAAARTRLLNYSGRRRALARHANELVAGGTKADTVILVGDAKFSSTFGGHNGSAGPMLQAILRLREQGWTVLEVRSPAALLCC